MLWIVMLCRNTAPIAAPPACIIPIRGVPLIPMHNGVTVSRWLWDTGALMVHATMLVICFDFCFSPFGLYHPFRLEFATGFKSALNPHRRGCFQHLVRLLLQYY